MKPATNILHGQPVRDHVEETAFKVKVLKAVSEAWETGAMLIVDVGKRDVHPAETETR